MGGEPVAHVPLGYGRWIFSGGRFGDRQLADEMMSGPATRPTPKRLEGVGVAADGPVG